MQTQLSTMLPCRKCGIYNAVVICQCGRAFLLTTAVLHDRRRTFEDGPLDDAPESLSPIQCEACAAASRGEPDIEAAAALQRTCPNCHAECLSDHGL